MSQPDNIEYYRRRAAEARSHADAATLPEVRHAHAAMAQRYQTLLGEAERAGPGNLPRPVLSIVTGD